MRSRDIKPGFFLNEQLAECSPLARLVFPGLWMVADREGRFEYRPKRLRAEILPYDRANMEKLLGELETQGLIVKYEANGKTYGWIPTFTTHQKPHPNERASEIPPCPLESATSSVSGNAKNQPSSEQGDTQVIIEDEADNAEAIIEDNQANTQNESRDEARNTSESLMDHQGNTNDIPRHEARTSLEISNRALNSYSLTPRGCSHEI